MEPTLTSTLVLQRQHYRAMQQHVATEAPLEACGLVASQGGYSVAVFPIPNALHSPTRFRMDPQAQWQAMRVMLAQNWEMLAIYHSHPQGPPHPSETDWREAAYPEAVYLIWAPVGAYWVCRAFRWTRHGFLEIPLRIA